MSKKIAMYATFGVGSLYLLSKFNYITINWQKIDDDIFHFIFRGGHENSGFVKYVKRMITHVAPLVSGFSSGFYYGWHHHHHH